MIDKKYIIIGLLILFVVSSYLLLSNKGSFYKSYESINKTESKNDENQTKKSFSTVIEGKNDISKNGIVVIKESENKTQVSIRMIGSLGSTTNSATQKTIFYNGTCKDLGEIKYVLNDVVNGSSETKLNTPFQEFSNGLPLALTIYEQNSSSEVYACADLIFK